jgi:hypothetical protein
MPDELSPRHIRRRLLELTALVGAVALLVLVAPGLGGLWRHLARSSPGWLVAGLVLEGLSALSYVVVFRAVFCPRMTWQLSYQLIGAGVGSTGKRCVLARQLALASNASERRQSLLTSRLVAQPGSTQAGHVRLRSATSRLGITPSDPVTVSTSSGGPPVGRH